MMLNTSYDPAEATRQGAASLLGLIRLARELVGTGRPVDLSGLQDQIGLLCAQALDLPPDQGMAVRPALEAVDAALLTLQRALQAPE